MYPGCRYDVSMMHVFRMYVSRMHISMMHASTMLVSMVRVSMMNVMHDACVTHCVSSCMCMMHAYLMLGNVCNQEWKGMQARQLEFHAISALNLFSISY